MPIRAGELCGHELRTHLTSTSTSSHRALCLDTYRRSQLERELQRERVSDTQRREYLDKLEARERDYTRLQRQRLSAADFEPLTIIGRGAFGEVQAGVARKAESLCSCQRMYVLRAALHVETLPVIIQPIAVLAPGLRRTAVLLRAPGGQQPLLYLLRHVGPTRSTGTEHQCLLRGASPVT